MVPKETVKPDNQITNSTEGMEMARYEEELAPDDITRRRIRILTVEDVDGIDESLSLD